jgi:tRNA-modifying protein YgfZ
MPINFSTSLAIYRWQPACWLRVYGDDAATFLQGQFTNDLRLLSSQPVVYGLWLTLKGKVLADSFVLRGASPNELWIGSYFSPAQIIRERIESHVIADDVTVEDLTASVAALSLVGEGTGERIIGAGAGPASASSWVFPGRRQRSQSYECVFLRSAGEPAVVAEIASTAGELSADELELRRISAGIPAVPVDVGPTDLPNEAALETEAISYTKGCYLGQEVMARLKSMGQVRRRLLRVCGEGTDIPALPAAVFAGSRRAGELRSAMRDGAGGWIGLAMLSTMHVTGETALSFVADAAPTFRLAEAT